MSIIFISDLHLSENLPSVTAKLRELLANLPDDLEALYILGDLFEVWIGDDAASPFQLEMAELFKIASETCPIYFMPGNRDFLLGKNFCTKSSMTYIPDPTVINLYGNRTLLAHGDGLCTQDWFFQFYRGIVRSILFFHLFLALPLSYRKNIATKMRQRSKRRNQHISDELMDINLESLKKLMRKKQCKQAIYGHTHRPALYYFDVADDIKKVYVLSDWHISGNTLEFDGNSLNKLDCF